MTNVRVMTCVVDFKEFSVEAIRSIPSSKTRRVTQAVTIHAITRGALVHVYQFVPVDPEWFLRNKARDKTLQ